MGSHGGTHNLGPSWGPQWAAAGCRALLLQLCIAEARNLRFQPHFQPRALPGHMEGGRDHELVVQRDAHVAGLVKGGGHGARGVAQGAAPQQEQHLGCRGEQELSARPRHPAAGTPSRWVLLPSGPSLPWVASSPAHSPRCCWCALRMEPGEAHGILRHSLALAAGCAAAGCFAWGQGMSWGCSGGGRQLGRPALLQARLDGRGN